MQKKAVIIISLLILLSFFGYKVYSEDCTTRDCWEQKIKNLELNVNSYNAQIQLISSRVSLTKSNIQQTEDKITTTEKEIDTLGSRIDGLDSSLSYLTRTLLTRISEGYKRRTVSLFSLFFDSTSANDLLDRIKYLKTAQDNNQKLLVQVQEAKLNFEEQKKLREEKVKQLDDLKNILAQQQAELEIQQQAERKLLAATESDLQKARNELAGFSAFTQAAGLGLASLGSGSNGWYYTQRDPQWGNITLPGSSSSVILAGCAVTSVAMVCKSYGQGTTPATIVGNTSNFIGGDLWNWAFSCSGKTTDWLGASQDQVKSYVKNNTPVILRLYAPSVSGLHFVVAFSWDDDKGDFKIHDPYYGPDKYFSERYSWSQVTQAIVIH